LAKTLMIQGTCSDAGKSILTAAFCRIYTRRGYKVAPFKSQNMALNSFVTPDGKEIGRAQAVQAQAACRDPHIDMNPILLKPEGNSISQVVLMGRPWKTLKAGDYYKAKPQLWNEVTNAMDRLMAENDIVIAEGAGSPAEINLKENEIVNMAVARYLEAPVLLTGDIDRGGVFASLYGTLELVDEDRDRIAGFLINKFRGDVDLLTPGLRMLEDRCGGVPVLGVIPMIPDIYLAQEDSVFIDKNRSFGDSDGMPLVVIKLPHMSNYDDFDPFQREKGINLLFVSSPSEIPENAAAIFLPGTKTTIQDLNWLKESGMSTRIRDLSGRGVPVIGICGGYQMMGQRIIDNESVETGGGIVDALNLLPLETEFSSEKTTVQSRGQLLGGPGFFRNIEGEECRGYEIHMGRTVLKDDCRELYSREDGSCDGAVSLNGKIWGSYMHGIFDNLTLRRGFLISLGWEPEEPGESEEILREKEFERLADAVEAAVDMDALDRLIGLSE
jgi:adenosylcobyric acid synthase